MRKLVCALCAAALLLAVLGAVTGSARREPLEIPARGLGPLPGATEIPLQSGWVDGNGVNCATKGFAIKFSAGAGASSDEYE